MSGAAWGKSSPQRRGDPSLEPMVRFDRVSKWFEGQGNLWMPALDAIDFSARQDCFVSIVGPSGCGKSTLLNLCAGLCLPDKGRVLFRGVPVSGVNTHVGYVTQDSNLLPWQTVLENVVLPLEIRGVPRKARLERARDWIDLVGLRGFEGYYPHQLSGGMQKRCALARTLVYDPDVILMDEPFGPLDAMTRLVLQAELLRLWERQHKTIIFVTHDLTEAVSLSDEVVALSRRPGRVKGVMRVPLERPRDVFRIAEAKGFPEVVGSLWSLFRTELGDATPLPPGERA